ncbi:DUF6207 family protein [Streptomyces sp. NPDC051569]|uniref:DUF6207 family protein n=1 Tax=Streptomyces sp. NPDC051569 TaxID=3365661 RepID=UPI0037BA2CDC
MNPINETYVSRPGLVVVDAAAADDATALVFQQPLADRASCAGGSGEVEWGGARRGWVRR